MPTRKILGLDVSAGDLGPAQVPQVPVDKAARAPIQIDRQYRNGRCPDASAFSELNVQANQAALWRTKEVFSHAGMLGTGAGIAVSSAGSGDRTRWMFAFRTSPFMHALLCRAVLYPQSSGFTSGSYARLDVYDTSNTQFGSVEFHYGTNPLDTANVAGWQYMKVCDRFLDGLSPDTEYWGMVVDVDNGLIQSLAVAELNSMTEHYSGYLATNYTAESLIVDKGRENIAALLPTLWRGSPASVLQFQTEALTLPQVTTSASAVNLIDQSSTTYGPSIPGYTLDMTGKARLSQQSTGVPVEIRAYMACTSAADGVLHLRDSSGTVIATLNNTGGVFGGWASASATLPATIGKYYLTFQTAAGQVKVWAVSIWEYET